MSIYTYIKTPIGIGGAVNATLFFFFFFFEICELLEFQKCSNHFLKITIWISKLTDISQLHCTITQQMHSVPENV